MKENLGRELMDSFGTPPPRARVSSAPIVLVFRIQNSWTNSLQLGEYDESQVKEVFINEGRGNSPSHLKFFLLDFSKLKEDIK